MDYGIKDWEKAFDLYLRNAHPQKSKIDRIKDVIDIWVDVEKQMIKKQNKRHLTTAHSLGKIEAWEKVMRFLNNYLAGLDNHWWSRVKRFFRT